jgi:integrase
MMEQNMTKPNLKLVSPATDKRAVGPLRRPNKEIRPRGEHLTETEVNKLVEAAKDNRHGHRDSTMIWITYRHGLRASEVCDLRWEQIDLSTAALHVTRAKGGDATTHPLMGDELRMLRKLQRDMPRSPYVFVTERGAPFTVPGFNWLVKRAGVKARMPFQVHAHMLRHACGYELANRGTDTRTLQGFMGHRSIQSTVRYAALASGRFKNIWR